MIVYHDTMSYPSGHTGFATALAFFALWALTRTGRRRPWHVVLAVLFVLLVALILWWLGTLWWDAARRRGGFWALHLDSIWNHTGRNPLSLICLADQ